MSPGTAHRVVAIIPARYASSRLPGKPLADIAGTKTLELRTIKRAMTGLGAWCTVRGEDGAKQLFSMLEGVKS